MIKTLRNIFRQDKERFVVPKGVQDVIPITAIYDDGIFRVGKDKFTKTFKFTDINYAVASNEDKKEMFLAYSELLNSFDSGATTKVTINNRRLNRVDFERSILIPLRGDELDVYRKEYNEMLLEKATAQILWCRTSILRYLSARRISRTRATTLLAFVMISELF